MNNTKKRFKLKDTKKQAESMLTLSVLKQAVRDVKAMGDTGSLVMSVGEDQWLFHVLTSVKYQGLFHTRGIKFERVGNRGVVYLE